MNQDEDRFDENPDSEDSEVHENQHEVDEQENERCNQLPKEIAVKSEIKEAACSSEPNIEESEAYDTFEDNIHYLNKKYQPYRDPKDDKEDVEDNSFIKISLPLNGINARNNDFKTIKFFDEIIYDFEAFE